MDTPSTLTEDVASLISLLEKNNYKEHLERILPLIENDRDPTMLLLGLANSLRSKQ